MDGCLFCEIAAGDRPAFLVHADEHIVAFLDTRPVFPGHTLVVPRAHVPTLHDLPAEAVGGYFQQVQRIAGAVESALEAQGTFVALNNRISQSVPHLHTHVVPRRKGDGLRGFFWPRTKYTDDAQAREHAAAIAAALAAG
ncbi:HIT family protein [Catellatospora sp. IY07-71]|uniref:HIT family protein n=1 Tax=Catellatospora sp. IY07-71 TaxID=2728827 RepID=UPI001BB3B720|nr:HIT family protein [Catellatospora sp. IY07-71]BCJ75605.1 HIT family protein [Catellatospora sp. IY07-71]